jgi:outer membrane protein
MNIIKKTFSILLISTIFYSFSYNANAAEIAVIDVEKIIKESKVMRYIQRNINDKQNQYQKEVESKQGKLEKEQKLVEGKRNILSQEAFNKEVKEFDGKVDELKTYVDRRQNSLKKASLEAMSKVNDEIKEIISDLSKENGYDIIIPASQALFYKDKYDISEEVLKRLNKKITKVKIKFN